ncbi:MAG: hppD, partial [Ferruginibacter sp.]|nr:hppD [Ferruginibacter sp.]
MYSTLNNDDKSTIVETDFLPLLGTDYVEFYVGNAKQAAHFYKTAFGFQSLAYAGPETGMKDKVSYVLQQNKLTFVLTTPLRPGNAITDHIQKHGDGVKFLALKVEDATSAWIETTRRGGESYLEPISLKDEAGEVVMSGIHTYGDTVHLFIERQNYSGVFMPGFKPWKSDYNPTATGLLYVDHCVGNVGWNQMNPWVKFYETVMGFRNILTFDDKDISTEYSALMSKVMSNGNGYVKFPINEPAEGKKKSQVEEYLDFYNGEGVQHVAIATDNIVNTVTELKARGIEFLKIPASYYEDVLDRVGKIDEDLDPLSKLGILI